MKVYEKIKELCIEHGTTISALERQLSFGKGSVSKWKENHPNTAHLIKAADFFGVSTDYLLGRSKVKTMCPEEIDGDCLEFIVKVQELGLDKEVLNAVFKVIIENYTDKKNLTNL